MESVDVLSVSNIYLQSKKWQISNRCTVSRTIREGYWYLLFFRQTCLVSWAQGKRGQDVAQDAILTGISDWTTTKLF